MLKQDRPRASEGSETEDLARKWQALAERRAKYLLDIHRSGRWQRYFTEEQLTAQMRETLRAIERWSAMSGKPPSAPDNDTGPLAEAAE